MGFVKEGEALMDREMILEGLRWVYSSLMDLTAKQDTLAKKMEGAQLTLDAMFSYLMRVTENDALAGLQILRDTQPVLDFFIANVHPNWYGPALYYKFKFKEFPGPIYENMKMYREALAAFNEAMDVWWEMHSYKSYGSGNGAMDPYFEGSRVLESVAMMAHHLGEYRRGVEAIKMVIDFYEEIWAIKSAANIPVNVLILQGNRLLIGVMCASDMGDFWTAKQFVDKGMSMLTNVERTLEQNNQLRAFEKYGEILEQNIAQAERDGRVDGGADGPVEVGSFNSQSAWTSSSNADNEGTPKLSKRMFRRKKKQQGIHS